MHLEIIMGFPGGSVVKNPPAKQETKIQSLGQEDSLEKAMVTHSSILAWEIPRAGEPGGLQSMGSQRLYFGMALFVFCLEYIKAT